MIPPIRYYRNQSSFPCVQATPEHVLLGDYLADDLQDGGTATEVLAALKNVAKQGEREMSGNSFTITMDKDQVALELLFNEANEEENEEEAGDNVVNGYYRLPTEKFQILLTEWIDFLDNDGLLARVPVFN